MLIKRKRRRNRLVLELVLMCGISLLAAYAAAKIAENAALNHVIEQTYNETNYEKKTGEALTGLQNFIQEQKVTEDNIELLMGWIQRQRDVYIMFYRDVETLFGPYLTDSDEEEDERVSEVYETTYYDLELYDGTPIKVQLECYLDTQYMYMVDLTMYAVGAVVFVVLLFLLIHHKIRYINRLAQELEILGSGNLEYPMTVRGHDELTSLAEGIERLKNGILEQQQIRDEAEKANAELVTAMSHDLRTPLTSLIGYLELLTMHRYGDETELQKYLSHCRDKAFQIKKMSDRLFEYFLVYAKREQKYRLSPVPCADLLEDLCNTQFFDWQEQGGRIECRIGEIPGSVNIDSEYLQRVLDNLLSNLKKYGDPAQPLVIESFERQDMLHILLTNHVREQKDRIQSTQIGLKSCRKIMEEHGGHFEWRQTDGEFQVELMLPVS